MKFSAKIICTFVMVKKLLPIFLLSIYLVSVTELHELFKLPQLVEHFIEHKAEDKQTTFLDFLVLHYSNSDDGGEHSNLPFKAHHDNGNSINSGFVAFNSFCLVIKSTPIESQIFLSLVSIAPIDLFCLGRKSQPTKITKTKVKKMRN